MRNEKRNPLLRLGDHIKGLFKNTNSEEKVKDRKMGNNGYWFETEIKKNKYVDRISRINAIDEYLRREHKVLSRPDFEFKEKTFETAKIILQTLKSIIKFHIGYICSNPVSLTGDKELVSFLNKVYKKGSDNKTDMENMKMQHECSAMSRQTIIDRSPYTTDTSLEMERIEAERIKDEQNASGNTSQINSTDADTDNGDKPEVNIDDKVD